jgi:hypothetical protein
MGRERFDPALANLKDHPAFEPFQVKRMMLLADAIEKGIVDAEEAVLHAKIEGKSIVLLTRQMTYHHVAQGIIGEKPWMVSF